MLWGFCPIFCTQLAQNPRKTWKTCWLQANWTRSSEPAKLWCRSSTAPCTAPLTPQPSTACRGRFSSWEESWRCPPLLFSGMFATVVLEKWTKTVLGTQMVLRAAQEGRKGSHWHCSRGQRSGGRFHDSTQTGPTGLPHFEWLQKFRETSRGCGRLQPGVHQRERRSEEVLKTSASLHLLN